jgi:aspartate aminotransferase
MILSERINSIAPSETLAMSQKSSDLRAQGLDVINLSVGEPDFFTPTHIKNAAKYAIDDNYSFYSPVPGFGDLRLAVTRKFKREHHLDYSPLNIVISNGAKQALANVLLCLLNPGDEVIIPAPYWVSYVEMVKLAQGASVIIPATIDQDFKITPEQLEAAITPRTRVLILCSPSNPTGSVYTRDELNALADVLRPHREITILSDEIYEHINYTGRHDSIAHCDSIRYRTVIVNGVSKAYAMTGWRIGYIAAPIPLAQAVTKLQGQYTSGPCSVAQRAATAALSGDQTCVEEMRQTFLRRRDLGLQILRDIPRLRINEPQGAFYLFPQLSDYFGTSVDGRTIHNINDLTMYLLDTAHVATVSGAAFGSPTCLRLSYATSDEKLSEALLRIQTALARLH